jgi:hypothetical protein
MMPPFSVNLPAMVNVITGMAATMPKVHFASKITVAKAFLCDNSPAFSYSAVKTLTWEVLKTNGV